MRRITRRGLLGLTAAFALASALPVAARAQSGGSVKLRADGEPDKGSPRTNRNRRLNLFGLADAAFSSIKTSNPKYYWLACNNNGSVDCGFSWAYSFGGPSDPSYIFLDWGVGTPPSVRDSIKAKNPGATGLNSAIGNGFDMQFDGNLAASDVLLASDNQLGAYLSGVQSTNDKTCRDHTHDIGSGNPLLPGSDCSATWGPLGWQGRKPVPGSDYLNVARTAIGLQAFKHVFDFWTYPNSEPTPDGKLDRQFGSFQTYGFFRDYSKDEVCGTAQTRTYGKVVAGTTIGAACGAAITGLAPTKPGYPLGLEWRFDAFAYGIPALSDMVFYQATVTNNSAEAYGTGVDYDSLYIGFLPTSYSFTQRNMVYYRPELGALIHTAVCSHQALPPCNGAAKVADLKTNDVIATGLPANGPGGGGTGTAFGAYELGAAALVLLKSPIGDLRNKLFSKAGSPFAAIPGIPSQVLDDTITFQHGHLCGFRACNQTTYVLDYKVNADAVQRQFDMMSSRDVDVLGVRTPAGLGGAVAGQILWHTFRSADWPAAPTVGPAANQFPRTGGFNRWVPGGANSSWDWNDDGVQDTLYYDTCSSKSPAYNGASAQSRLSTGCVGLFSDTMPHSGPDQTSRWLNGYSNTGGVMTVGPIKLKAGETAAFVVAGVSACCGAGLGDSLAIMTKINAAIDHYMNFYLGPEALPKDSINTSTGVQVLGGNATGTRVAFAYSTTAETARDPFLLNLATKYAGATPGTPDYRLTRLNSWLVDSLLSYGMPFGTDTATMTGALGNFKRLYIFKSCDGGGTYTNNAACAPSPATGGPLAALGWLPYATIERDATGDIPNSFVDENVNGGSSYTYVILAETRGATFQLATGDSIETVAVSGGGTRIACITNCKIQAVTFAPSLFNALSTSGSNVVAVYVPASLAAGGQQALVSVTTTQGPVPADRLSAEVASVYPVEGDYAVQMYDSVQVSIRDSLDADGKARLSTRSTVTGFKGTTASAAVTNDAVGGIGLNGAAARTSTITSAATYKIRTVTYGFVGTTAVLAGPQGPVLATKQLNKGATPETFGSTAAYPGFNIAFDETGDLAFNPSYGQQFIGPDGKRVVELVKPFVQVRTGKTTLAAAAEGGIYKLTWTDKPFGAAEPFRLMPATPAKSDSIFQASLNGRAVGTTGLVDAATATAIGGGTTVADLVPVQVPFTITNVSFNRPVSIAMKKRAASTFLLGTTGVDTQTVTIPANTWVPGDQLYLLEDTQGIAGTGLDLTFSSFTLGCDPVPNTGVRESCNPVALLTPGSSTWITTKATTQQSFLFNPRLTSASQFGLTVTGTKGASGISNADVRSNLKNVHAVPNPYVVFTPYGDPQLTRPMLFTHVPPNGTMRIYTVSGQVVQQLRWTAADLNETGDLLWNLRTREGLEISGGLYLFVVTGTDASGTKLGSHMGKFVVIR